MIGLRVILGHGSEPLSSLFVLEKRSAQNIDSWELGISSDELIRCIKDGFLRILLDLGSVGICGGEFVTSERGGRLHSSEAEANSSSDGLMTSILIPTLTYARSYDCHCFDFTDGCIRHKSV
jgi:hypothetical protein